MRRVMALLFSLTFLILPARAAQSRKYVALTFDDGPSGRYTRTLLDGLYDRGAKATFLLCGYRVELYPKEAARIAAEGHEIGLHGYSHAPMCDMSETQVTGEIQKTAQLLPDEVRFLRPPGGKYNEATIAAARKADLAILFYENEKATTLRMALEEKEYATVSLLTGPEGGLEDREVEQAKEMGLRICTLGSRILRCETAPLCALSAVMYASGEF